MALDLTVDPDAAVPAYEQLRSRLAGAIVGGQLAQGDRLPTARALASDVGVAVNTVIRAYAELSRQGLIEVRRRFGTVVAGGAERTAPADVQAAATRLAMRAAAAGLTPEQTVDLVRAAATAVHQDPGVG